jgi:uncharacterized protein (DUF58 family)
MKRAKRKKRRRHPVAGIFWICFLGAAAFSYAMFQGGFVSWFLFYSVMPILLYTLVTAAFPMRSLDVMREVNREIFNSGAAMHVKVTVTKHSWIPLFFLIVDDRLPEKLQQNARSTTKDGHGSRALFFPGLKRQVAYTYIVEPMPRGEFDLVDIELKTGDIFGFIQKTHTVSAAQNVFVYPRYQQIHSWEPFKQYEEGSRRSRHNFHYDMTSVAGVRDYTPGDRLSWLDWKSLARTNKLLTKEFERPLNEDLIICLDRHNTHYKEGDPLFEKAVTAAASMVRYGVGHGSSIGFLSFGREKTVIPLSGGSEQQWKIFTHLARVKPDGEGNHFPLLSQAFRRFPPQANVIYITPVVDRRLLQLTENLVKRKQKVGLILPHAENEEPGTKVEEIEHLKRQGVEIYMIDGHDLNEALKAGAHYATS